MNDISIVISGQYGSRLSNDQLMPMIKKLNAENKLCMCYGCGFPRKYKFTDEPLEKFDVTKIPTRLTWYLISPLARLLHIKGYSGLISQEKIFEMLYASKIAKDNSKLVYAGVASSYICDKSRKKGKKIATIAGLSEPIRQYERITSEYDKFNIDVKKRTIYGNLNFAKARKEFYQNADYVVSISKVSHKTYEDAGYDMKKFHLIPLTGSNFLAKIETRDERRETRDERRERCFVSTAFHSFIKGTHRLLNAWRKAHIKNIPLHIVGPLHDDLKEFIEKSGPFENVIFDGYQSNLPELYKNFDAVGVLLSLSEGAGRVTPELMSFGFPMITSLDASCDLVQDGYNGKIVDTKDEEQIVEALRHYADDWERVHAMNDNVIKSLNNRTVSDFSLELCDYLMSLI